MNSVAVPAGPPRALRARSALVLGDHRHSLAVARSLHRAGYRVIAGRAGPRTVLERSRCVAEVWEHPPYSEPLAWAEALETFSARREDVGMIYPVGDREIECVEPLAARLPVLVVVARPLAALAVCRSKRTLLALASETGVPTQPWEAVMDRHALGRALRRVGLPAVLKPDRRADGGPGFKAKILHSEEEARRLAEQITFPACGFVLQRLQRGLRHNLYFVAREGRLLGHAQVRMLRTNRPDGTGLAVEGVSVSPSRTLLAWTAALAARLSYTGVGCAQFMVDEAAGTESFLEINARLGANCAAVGACGLDLPRLFIDALLGVAGEQAPARIGRRYAWLDGDLYGLASCLSSGRMGLTEASVWLARTVAAQLRAHDQITWSWRDPLPALVILGPLIRSGLRRLIPGRQFPRSRNDLSGNLTRR